MALGQELGLVFPIFAHAGVVKMLQHMWKEWGWGRSCSWLEGRGKKRESCLKQNPPNTKSLCGCGGKGEEQSRAEQGCSGTGLRAGARHDLCSPSSPLVLLGTMFGCPLEIVCRGRILSEQLSLSLCKEDLPSPCVAQDNVSGAQRSF